MKDLKKNLLRYHQREELQQEIKQVDDMLPHAKPQEKGALIASRNKTKKQLDEQSPEPLTAKEKDTLFALEKRLLDRIKTNMPSQEVMRKNPPGAVDWHNRWEKKNKPLIQMWKNAKIQLNPDNDDRDLCNIEKHRPIGQVGHGVRADAQIVGLMSYQDIPEEQWPFDAPENTAAKQAQRVYDEGAAGDDVNAAIESLGEEEIVEKDDDGRRKATPEEHALLVERLRKGREVLAQKRADAKLLEENLHSVGSPLLDPA